MNFDNIQSNFSAGELSPKLQGRVELEQYFFGAATLENMIVQPSGGLAYRGGFHYVAAVKDSSKKTILINFNYKNLHSYILEFGDLYLRIYADHEQIQVGGSPYEVTTTYTEDELAELRICQDSDTLYIVHPKHKPAKLTRAASYSWKLEDIDFTTGEYADYTSQNTLSSSPPDNQWRSVCWSPELNLFCAVADTGTNNRVMTSPDGVYWEAQWAPNEKWYSICWSPELKIFCVVGTHAVMTSSNGTTWTERTPAANNYWKEICWSSELELFCAVSSNGTNDRVMTSPDGITWTSQDAAVENNWFGICWSSELALFCATSVTGTANQVMTSPDGITWTSRTTTGTGVNWWSICWSSDLDLFCAVAGEISGTRIMTSPDGITWTVQTSPASGGGWLSVCWSPELLLFCATALSVTGVGVMTSPDGITWTGRTPAADNMWLGICWSSKLELFCAVAMTGTGDRVMTSPDGITWTIYTSIVANMWNDVCWSPELKLLCAVASSGTDRTMTSPDGFEWTIHNAPSATWDAICWSPALMLFCAVGPSAVMTSPDGTTWTSRTPAALRQWTAVCWSPELALFCAVSNDAGGAGERMMTSIDGINWILRSSVHPGLHWTSICWSPELSLFCAVSTGTLTGGAVVMLSLDGITWDFVTDAPDTADWDSVCWSPELNLFCAVATTSDVDGAEKIMTSPNGWDWTLQSALSETGWTDVCWSSELEIFYAISRIKGGIITSLDGVNWTLLTTLVDNLWTGVCWSPDLLLFCSVSTNSVGAVGDQVAVTKYFPPILWKINDYPSLTWFFEQRHFFAATSMEPNTVWGSQSADYTNMGLGTGLDNEALKFVIKAAYKFLWASAGQEIMLGGSNAEFRLTANAFNEALTPTNIRPLLQTQYGSAELPPIRIDDSVVFVQKTQRKFRRLVSDHQANKYDGSYKASDITILSSHITKSGIIDIAYSTAPDTIIWAVREDGTLIGLTYEPEHKVYGWHRHLVGGTDAKVKNIAVGDELWAIIEHTIDGSTVQYIVYMDEGLSEEDKIEDAFFVDFGITKTGSQFTLVDGLDHLEGEEVQILGDGAVQAPKTIVSGEITLDQAVDKVHVGLQYSSIIETMPIEGGNPVGTAQGFIKKVNKVSLRLRRSLGFKLGDVHGNLDQYNFGPSVMDDSPSLFTGDTDPILFAGSYDLQSRLKIVHDSPLPFNLLAIMYRAKV